MSSAWSGRLVRLRALEDTDAEAIAAADSDTAAAQSGWRVFPPRPAWAVAEWIEQAARSANDGDGFRLGIETVAAAELVGTIATHDCDPVPGTFGYDVAIFDWARRHGYGREAVVLLLRHLFGERRYQKCTVGVIEWNGPSLALHTALGFQVEGRVRRAHFTGGRLWDEVVLGITAEEFAERWAFNAPG
jgi:RimJ/RimL family protein N-acetyltransferase